MNLDRLTAAGHKLAEKAIAFVLRQLRIDGDCAGRCYRPRVTQQIGFDPGQGADTELDACYALGALFGGDAL